MMHPRGWLSVTLMLSLAAIGHVVLAQSDRIGFGRVGFFPQSTVWKP